MSVCGIQVLCVTVDYVCVWYTGAPCDNFKGYCDVFQKCRAVNEDGPLARLKNLLFNQQTFNDIKAWITVMKSFYSCLAFNLGPSSGLGFVTLGPFRCA